MHGNVGPVLLTESYRELFTAVATCAAGLTGLLFVAISVGPREGKPAQPAVIHHVRAASALVAFTNALVVSLFGLVPGQQRRQGGHRRGRGRHLVHRGQRPIDRDQPRCVREQALRQAGLITLLLAAFGAELGCGIGVTINRTAVFGPELLGDVLIAMLLIGIARAWELVGDRDTGILSSLAVLVGHSSADDTTTPLPAERFR